MMEKYSQDHETLVRNLRDEEAQLMTKVSSLMSSPIKTASQQEELQSIEGRLKMVRDKITEMDLGKSNDSD